MADFVRASHPVYGTRVIPSSWLATYPGAWTTLDDGDPGTLPDPLPAYVRDTDLDLQVAELVQAGNSATAVAQRAAFERLWSVSPLDHGAKFNGVTNDTAALAAAATAAVAAGAPLRLPAGTAMVTTWSPPSELKVVGPGPEHCAIRQAASATSTTAVTVDVSGTTSVRLEGFTIDGNLAAFGAVNSEHKHALKSNDVTDLTVIDLVLTNAKGDGWYIGSGSSGVSGAGSSGIKADRVRCVENWRAGCSIIALQSSVFTACDFSHNAGTSPQTGLNIEPNFDTEQLSDVRFIGCTADGNTGRGWQFIARLGVTTQGGIRLIGCTARNNGDDGCRIYNINDLELSGCDFSDNGQYGLNFQNNGARDVKVVGGVYNRNGQHGIIGYANSGQVLSNIKLIGVDTLDNGQAGGGTYAGIYFDGGTGTVEGLHISGCTSRNTGAGTTQSYGVRTGAPVSTLTLTDNDLRNNAISNALLNDNGATRVAHNNRGANTAVPWSTARYKVGRYYGTPDPATITATSAISAGTMTVSPFPVDAGCTVDRIAAEIVTAAPDATVRLGIYRAGRDGFPAELVLDAGTIDGATTGAKEITVSQVLPAGLYYLAAAAQGGAPTTRQITGASGVVGSTALSGLGSARVGMTATGVTGALPATFTIAGDASNVHRVFVRVSA